MATKRIKQRGTHFLAADRAVSALEYAILVGVVVVAIGLALSQFQTQVTAALSAAGAKLSSVPGISP